MVHTHHENAWCRGLALDACDLTQDSEMAQIINNTQHDGFCPSLQLAPAPTPLITERIHNFDCIFLWRTWLFFGSQRRRGNIGPKRTKYDRYVVDDIHMGRYSPKVAPRMMFWEGVAEERGSQRESKWRVRVLCKFMEENNRTERCTCWERVAMRQNTSSAALMLRTLPSISAKCTA